MKNTELASLLEEMRQLLELSNANPFKIRAYGRASQALSDLTRDVASMSREELLEIDGIGQGIADKIQEYLKTGHVEELKELQSKFPHGVIEMMRLPGLGPKKALLLFKEKGVDSPAKLKKLAEAGKLRDIPGFGEKTEQNLLKGISFAETTGGRITHWEARQVVDDILAVMKGTPGLQRIEPAGSFRRLKETSGDLDFLCSSNSPGETISRFTRHPNVERILAAGDTKASVILKRGLQCDLRVVKPDCWGSALLYFTGSKEHNVRLRELALKKGMTINEYGIFRLKGKKDKPVASKTEEEMYKVLGLDYIPPELREDRGEIQAAAAGKLPRLVTLKDIKGDFHNHTELTDGAHTHEAMIEAARKKGWKWVFIGDHSQSLTIAKGLKPAELRRKIETIRRLNQKHPGLEVLCSMEVDILADGKMDYDDETLNEIDCVIASVHSRFNQPEDVMTARIQKALANPNVDILGHLTGRLIGKRESYAVNIQQILETARQTKSAIEINGQADRQELSDTHAKTAHEMGVKLAVTTDAHSTGQFDNMEMAVCVARRAWVEPRHLLNCMDIKELKEWLKDRR